MTLGEILTEAMSRAKIRDEHVAAKLGVSVPAVCRWRLSMKEPNRVNYDALRALLPEFAKQMDEAAVAKHG